MFMNVRVVAGYAELFSDTVSGAIQLYITWLVTNYPHCDHGAMAWVPNMIVWEDSVWLPLPILSLYVCRYET